MKKIILIIIVSAFLCAACQPTPETEVVQSKNDGVLEQVISEGEKVYESDDGEQDESEDLVEIVEERAEMLNVAMWTEDNIDGNQYITISSDAQILMPDVDEYIAYEITPLSPIPEDILYSLLELIAGDNPLYDGYEKSLEEIENTILRLRQLIFDYENDEFKDTFSEGNGKTYEEFKREAIENLELQITALEEDIANGNYGVNTTISIKDISNGIISCAKTDLGRDMLAIFMTDELHSLYFRNPGNYGIDYLGLDISEYLSEEEKELDISADEAIEIISNLMNDAGIAPYDIRYMGIAEEYSGSEEIAGYSNLEQGYVLIYSRIVNGMPVECSSDFDITVLEDGLSEVEYFSTVEKYYDEKLSFVVDDMGLTQMDWAYYYDIDYQSARTVEILQMDDELKQIITQQIINCYSFYEDLGTTVDFDIERVELVMGRVPMKDNPDKQWLVPMWNVYANYEVSPVGEETYTTPNSILILSINALDGSMN